MSRPNRDHKTWVEQELDRLGINGKCLWSEKACATYRGCSVSLCQKERHLGKGPAYLKIGRLVRYRPEDVISFCLEHRIEPLT